MKTLGINRVILESDAQHVIFALNNTMKDFFYFSLVISDYKILAKDLVEFSFVFTNKSANQVAHT